MKMFIAFCVLFLALSSRASYSPTTTVWDAQSGFYLSVNAAGEVKVNAAALPLPAGASQEHTAANSPNACRLSDGTSFISTLPVSAASLPLPSGASTAANQVTTITALQSLDSKAPSLMSSAPSSDTGQSAIPVRVISQLGAGSGGSSGGLTDVQLRASAVPVSLASAPTTPVTGAFWQATQPVSGTFWQATQPVSIASMPSTPVTGTFWPATQPVSAVSLPLPTGAAQDATLTGGTQTTRLTDGTNTATVKAGSSVAVAADKALVVAVSPNNTVGVTGTFWQGTQPVSLASAPTTPVTGTFWQATQPVSIASMPSTPVTGTFWQATQPVSGTVTANAGTGTMAVSAASLPLPSGAATDASVTGLQVGQASTTSSQKGPLVQGAVTTGAPSYTTAQTSPLSLTTAGALRTDSSAVTQPVSVAAAVTVAQPTAASLNATVVGGTLTKGTQGATGFSIQQLKDAGRNVTNYFMATQIVSTATDALMSLTGYKGGAAVAATTTPAVVTAGKTYRIVNVVVSYVTIVTTPGAVRFTLRANTGGVVAITSPAVTSWEVGEPTSGTPVAGKWNTVSISIPDGMEFAAGTGIGVSLVGLGATGTAAAVGYGKISIHGYEY